MATWPASVSQVFTRLPRTSIPQSVRLLHLAPQSLRVRGQFSLLQPHQHLTSSFFKLPVVIHDIQARAAFTYDISGKAKAQEKPGMQTGEESEDSSDLCERCSNWIRDGTHPQFEIVLISLRGSGATASTSINIRGGGEVAQEY
ncbi:hypothetical protein BGW80DRAFT_1248648 [Lactifluus volemus]|nr:hypothetical protein BGW80DRAFT_1248648 [Lactifluus volemus]